MVGVGHLFPERAQNVQDDVFTLLGVVQRPDGGLGEAEEVRRRLVVPPGLEPMVLREN